MSVSYTDGELPRRDPIDPDSQPFRVLANTYRAAVYEAERAARAGEDVTSATYAVAVARAALSARAMETAR